jgi:glycosyltransferase involved in cell wall biosynthesis
MKLLITTQVVDKDDLFLGFFHGWLVEFAKHFEHITVICLKEGKHELPSNVKVFSLGKENGEVSRLRYALRFLRLVWRLRQEYEAVLVHMNQEYILIAGWLWRRLHKKIYMWRNHYAGSALTDRAARYCEKIFCTSKYSYTAKYPKTVFMPVGVDTRLYERIPEVPRDPRAILFYARLSPSKRPDMLIQALTIVQHKGVSFVANFYGTPLPKDESYLESLKDKVTALGLGDVVRFFPGAPHSEGPRIFNAHAIFADLGRSGMYNKMLFEAAACECMVVTASKDFAELVDNRFIFAEDNVDSLAEKIEALLKLSLLEEQGAGSKLHNIAKQQSLEILGSRLAQEIITTL